jgi:hypothetical protein
LVLQLGCASVEARPAAVVNERVIRTEAVEGPPAQLLTTIAAPGNGELVVETTRGCEIRERRIVERELETRYENKSPWVDVTLASGGLALTAAGITTLIDAPNVAPAHSTGPDYNPVGGGTAAVIGTGMLVGGLVLGALVAIDVVRVRRVGRRTEVIHAAGGLISAKAECQHRQGVEGVDVELRLGRLGYGAGKTDAEGRIATTLDAVLPPEAHLPLRNASAKVVVGGEVEGELDLRAFAVQREELAWQSVNLQQCADALTADACARVQSHLSEYPDGPHVEDARRTLAHAAPQLAKLNDQLAWRRVQSSMRACSGRDASEAIAIDVACGVVAGYVRDFPHGEHVREAETAVAAGRVRSSAMRATGAKNEREKCVAGCRMHCATASVSLFDECFKGCIEGQCTK